MKTREREKLYINVDNDKLKKPIALNQSIPKFDIDDWLCIHLLSAARPAATEGGNCALTLASPPPPSCRRPVDISAENKDWTSLRVNAGWSWCFDTADTASGIASLFLLRLCMFSSTVFFTYDKIRKCKDKHIVAATLSKCWRFGLDWHILWIDERMSSLFVRYGGLGQ